MRGFFRLRVLRFRPGSVIADLEVTTEQNSTTTGEELVEVVKETPPSEELEIDLTSVELLVGKDSMVYCVCFRRDDRNVGLFQILIIRFCFLSMVCATHSNFSVHY